MQPAVPFVANHPDNMHCVLAVFRMLNRYFLGSDLSWEEIDRIARAVPGKGTWTFPLESRLASLGVPVKSIESVDYRRLAAERPEYLREIVGEANAEYYREKTNLPHVLDLIPEYIRLVPHESRKATVAEIVGYLAGGKLVAAEVDAGRLNGGKFDLHSVLLIATDRDTVTLHDPGLPPHESRVLSVEAFASCFSYEGAGCGIAVFG
jgi:hypothetical protein